MMTDAVVDSIGLLPWSWQAPEGFTLRGRHSPPSGKPVLHFMHGTGLCSLSYWPLLQRLLPQVDLFLSDVHGHGDSDGQAPFVGWNRSAELALLAWQAHAPQFGDVPVIAGGHSLGALLSSMMLGMAPGVFNGGLLLDPVVMPPAMRALAWLGQRSGLYANNALVRRARLRRAQWPSRQAAHDYLHGRGVFADWHDDALAAYIDHGLAPRDDGSRVLKCPPAIEADIFGSLPQRQWPLLDALAVPCDVVMGQQSYPFALRAARRWARRNALVTVSVVPGSHCFMQAEPQATAALVGRLLAAQGCPVPRHLPLPAAACPAL
jgi:pimeloyl-ACP methyl ester carboxylesterase